MLWAGIVGNLAVLALWLVSRTVGIPGIGARARAGRPVGPHLRAVGGCDRGRLPAAAARARPCGPRTAAHPIHPFVLFWLVLSVLALGMLSVSGAAA